ncbi:MAG: glycine cleavage system aminomethyltransferase GcvT [Chloroflexi bacterium]|nr:glycine cleavage system aminomethyltransferase GcvT [Chloroflexota bacterium]
MDDFLFRGTLADIDPDVKALVELEALRQARKLIMIPSEATVPLAVRETVGSVFHNIYAEGYPPADWRWLDEDQILDVDARLAEIRRYSGKRYYQGTEIADIVESLARRRTAERLANERVSPDKLFVNVQPLSGAPANSAVYTALLKPGDTLMGMDLLHGGHLTHGSPVARSGLQYNIVSYGVHEDGRIHYDDIAALAREHQPQIIIGGYTSYPWSIDWEAMREIADEVGAVLLADISHVAGLVIAGVYPSPVGIADVVMFTTHKTVAGPRGAVLLTHQASMARKLDRGVFPGEQGGPHVNSIAALAVAMKLAGTTQFKALQQQTVYNAKRLAQRFEERGLVVAYGGTDTHMVLINTGAIQGQDGTPLSGDMAARMLDWVGIACNRNTIPGDTSPFRATGIRLGTPWVTQRGLREEDMDRIGDIIADLLLATQPFSYAKGFTRQDWRAKVDYGVYIDAQQRVNQLVEQAGIDYEVPTLEQFYQEADAAAEHFRVIPNDEPSEDWHTIEIKGAAAGRFLDTVMPTDILPLGFGDWQPSWLLDANGQACAQAIVERLTEDRYLLHVARDVDNVAQWLTSLSDGYTQFDPTDVFAKVPGPVSVSILPDAVALQRFEGFAAEGTPRADNGVDVTKAYFIGCHGDSLPLQPPEALPEFLWEDKEPEQLLSTPLHGVHISLGAKMIPFAGYDMPVWYTSVGEEHHATREHAGLFDVSHMGVFEFSGPGAEAFLNAVTTNDVATLSAGDAHYSYLLGVDGIPLDDIFVYRLEGERFMVVVNAANNDKDWAWLNAVKDGRVAIDRERPWVKAPGRLHLELRDLRDPASGDDRRVDIALQGPASRDILLALDGSAADKAKVKGMKWANVTRVTLDGYDLVISRTGYTGERVAYEIFVHPNQAASLFQRLVDGGAVPCGLAARDSLRIEAGLPLYGHELAGDYDMNPADAGFSSFVKLWKPFFVGKPQFMEHEARREQICTRFTLDRKGVRPPQPGDPVMDQRGRVVGVVTSCSIDMDGYQTGQALVKTDFMAEGTPVLIYCNAGRSKNGKPPGELRPGDRTTVPEGATIQSRFPKRR